MRDRLIILEENAAELALFKKKHSLEELKKTKTVGWALRYGFLESIQIIIDISCHVVSKYNLGNPGTYGECIELLRKFKYIDEELAEKLTGMVGLRNILAHEYTTVRIEKLYELLEKLDDIKEFIQLIKPFI
ncbi:MAG: DUF86 domain-containing protein [Acidobacteria bacterium]|jgi:uncharacterized protein YutE (UPF0331/DUF86 family)|nr:DUF86 domain-containing protein [Acidobacteriota bacterium]